MCTLYVARTLHCLCPRRRQPTPVQRVVDVWVARARADLLMGTSEKLACNSSVGFTYDLLIPPVELAEIIGLLFLLKKLHFCPTPA